MIPGSTTIHSFRASAPRITGMGCVSALGQGLDAHWQGLTQQTVAIGPVPPWCFTPPGGERVASQLGGSAFYQCPYPVFACAEDALGPGGRELLRQSAANGELVPSSRTLQLTLNALGQALQQAGLPLARLRGQRVGIAVGTSVACTFNNPPAYWQWRKDGTLDRSAVERFLTNHLAAALHLLLGTVGPAAVVNNACASGGDAIGLAAEWLRAGRCDLALAGGSDELSAVAYNGFASLLLTDTAPCRPFDQHRQGLNLGEGAAMLVLESQQPHVTRAAVPTLGRVLGYGNAADGWHPTSPHPDGSGLRQALNFALEQAALPAQEIALINAHGTATPTNDQVEGVVVGAFFAEMEQPPMVSTKGMMGHTLGAAGALEAVMTLLALQHGETPGTAGCSTPDPALPAHPLPQGERASLRGKVGLSQSLAFGGCNTVLVLEATT